jgi:hypothetical protein
VHFATERLSAFVNSKDKLEKAAKEMSQKTGGEVL